MKINDIDWFPLILVVGFCFSLASIFFLYVTQEHQDIMSKVVEVKQLKWDTYKVVFFNNESIMISGGGFSEIDGYTGMMHVYFSKTILDDVWTIDRVVRLDGWVEEN